MDFPITLPSVGVDIFWIQLHIELCCALLISDYKLINLNLYQWIETWLQRDSTKCLFFQESLAE